MTAAPAPSRALAARVAALGLTVGGCAAAPEPQQPPGCPAVPPAVDVVAAGPATCAEQRFSGGDGRNDDDWIANARWRAIVRHPVGALTLAETAGGTIVDAAAWGRADLVLELVPLVGGGWLRVDRREVLPDGVRLSGVVRALPGLPADGEGSAASVTWRAAPDDPWLTLEGAQGVWLHPDEDVQVLDGWLVGPASVIGHDGALVEDLGGAVRLAGVTHVLFSDRQGAWAHRPGPHQEVSGVAPGAAEVALLRGGELVGLLPVVDDAFSGVIPADVDGLQGRAATRPWSPVAPPGVDLDLAVGPPGGVELRLGWGGPAHPVRATWTTADGRSGVGTLPPVGGRVAIGAGAVHLVIDAGPGFLPRALDVDVLPGATTPLSVYLAPALSPGAHVVGAVGARGFGDRRWRGMAVDRTAALVAGGHGYAVLTAEHAVASGGAYLNDAPYALTETGASLPSPDGWRITAWPWSAAANRPGGGAPDVTRVGPLDALRLAHAGARRYLEVDLAWLDAVQLAPYEVTPPPTHALLGPPTPDPLQAWAPWWTWLDAARSLLPTGPVMWLNVEDPTRWGAAELRRALNLGRYAAGTGALLTLDVDGVGPGGVLPRPSAPSDTDTARDSGAPAPTGHLARLTLQPGRARLDHLALVVSGQGEVARAPVPAGRDAVTLEVQAAVGLWAVGVAWSDDGADWVVTPPVWASRPWGPGDDDLPF